MIYQAVQEQDTIGWDRAVRGRLSNKMSRGNGDGGHTTGFTESLDKMGDRTNPTNMKKYAQNMGNSE